MHHAYSPQHAGR